MNVKSLEPYAFLIDTPNLKVEWYDKDDHDDVPEKFQEYMKQMPLDADVMVIDYVY